MIPLTTFTTNQAVAVRQDFILFKRKHYVDGVVGSPLQGFIL